MTIFLKLSSRNKKSLKKCVHAIKRCNIFGSNILEHFSNKKKNVVTVLKSPHVNKSAQEQFESRIHQRILRLNLRKKEKSLLFLKSVINSNFSDVKITVSYVVCEKLKLENFYDLNPDNFRIKKKSTGDLNLYMKLFDIYGSTINKTSCVFSSVGESSSLLS